MKHTHLHLRNGFSLAESRLLGMAPTGPEAGRGPESRVEAGAGGAGAEGPDTATLRANLIKDIQDLTKKLDDAGNGPAKRRAAESLQRTLDTVNRELAKIDEQLAAVVVQAEDAIARAEGGVRLTTDAEKKDVDATADELNAKYPGIIDIVREGMTDEQRRFFPAVAARFGLNASGVRVLQCTLTAFDGSSVTAEKSIVTLVDGSLDTVSMRRQFARACEDQMKRLKDAGKVPPPAPEGVDRESIAAIDAAKVKLDTAWGRLTDAERREVRLSDKYNDLTGRIATLKSDAGRGSVRDRATPLVAEINRFVTTLEEMVAPAEDRESITAIDAAKLKLDTAWGRLTDAERRDVRLADKFNDLTRRCAALKTEAATKSVRDRVPALTADVDRFVRDLEETFGAPEGRSETPAELLGQVEATEAGLRREWARAFPNSALAPLILADMYRALLEQCSFLRTDISVEGNLPADKVRKLATDALAFIARLPGRETAETPAKKITDAKTKLDRAWTAFTARATPGRRASDTHEELSRRFVALMAPMALPPYGEAAIDPAAADKYVADVDAFVRSITAGERLDDREEALILKIDNATAKLTAAWTAAPDAKKSLMTIAAYNGLLAAGRRAKAAVEVNFPGAAAAVDAYVGQVDRFVAALTAPDTADAERREIERLSNACRDRMESTVRKLGTFSFQSDRDNRVAERLRPAVTAKLAEAATKPIAEARVLIGQADALVLEAEAMFTREENWEKNKARAFDTMASDTWLTLPGNAGKPGFLYFKAGDGTVYAYCPTLGRDYVQTMDKTTLQWTEVGDMAKINELKTKMPSDADAKRLTSAAEVQRMKDLYPDAELRARIVDIAKAAPYNKTIVITSLEYGANDGISGSDSVGIGIRIQGETGISSMSIPMTRTGQPLNYPPLEEMATILACRATTGGLYLSDGQTARAAYLRRSEGLLGDGFGGARGVGAMRFDGRKPYFELPGGVKKWIDSTNVLSWVLSDTNAVPNLPEPHEEIKATLDALQAFLNAKNLAGARIERTDRVLTLKLRSGAELSVSATATDWLLVEYKRASETTRTPFGSGINGINSVDPANVGAIKTNIDGALRVLEGGPANSETVEQKKTRFEALLRAAGARDFVVAVSDGTLGGVNFLRTGNVQYGMMPDVSDAAMTSFVETHRPQFATYADIAKTYKNIDGKVQFSAIQFLRTNGNMTKTLTVMRAISSTVNTLTAAETAALRGKTVVLGDGAAATRSGDTFTIGVDATEAAISTLLKGAPAPGPGAPESNDQKKTRFEGLLRGIGATDYVVEVRAEGLPVGRKSGVGYQRDGKVLYVIAPDINNADMTAFLEEIRIKGPTFVDIAKTVRAINARVRFDEVTWHGTSREDPARTLRFLGFVRTNVQILSNTQASALGGTNLVIADGVTGSRTGDTVTIGIDSPIGEIERVLKIGVVGPEAPEVREALNTLEAHMRGKPGLTIARLGTIGILVTTADRRELRIGFDGRDRMEYSYAGRSGSSPVDCTNAVAVRAFADGTLANFIADAAPPAPERLEGVIDIARLNGEPLRLIRLAVSTAVPAITVSGLIFAPSKTVAGAFELRGALNAIALQNRPTLWVSRTFTEAELRAPGALRKIRDDLARDAKAHFDATEARANEPAMKTLCADVATKAALKYPLPAFRVNASIVGPNTVRVLVNGTSVSLRGATYTDVSWENRGGRNVISSVVTRTVASNSLDGIDRASTVVGRDLTADNVATAFEEANRPNPGADALAANIETHFGIPKQNALNMLKFSILFRDYTGPAGRTGSPEAMLPAPGDAAQWARAGAIARAMKITFGATPDVNDLRKVVHLWEISAGVHSAKIVDVLEKNTRLLTNRFEPARTAFDTIKDRSTILVVNEQLGPTPTEADIIRALEALQNLRADSFAAAPGGEGLDERGRPKPVDVLVIIEKDLAANLEWAAGFQGSLNRQTPGVATDKKIVWVEDHTEADFYAQCKAFAAQSARNGRHLAVVTMVHGPSDSSGMALPFKDNRGPRVRPFEQFRTNLTAGSPALENASYFLESCFIGRHLRRAVPRASLRRTYAGADTTVNALDSSLTQENVDVAFEKEDKKVIQGGVEKTINTYKADMNGDGVVTFNELRYYIDSIAIFHDGVGYTETGDRLVDAGRPRPDPFGGRGEPTASA